MRNYFSIILTVVCMMFIFGCAASKTYYHTSAPGLKKIETPGFNLSVEPLKKDGHFFSVFRVAIDNRSPSGIEINWNKSRYFHNKQNQGKFVYKGIKPSSVKDGTIPNSIIPPESNFSIDIAPFSRISYAKLRDQVLEEPGLRAGMLPEGENLVRLALVMDGQIMQKEISVIIKKEIK